MPYATRSRTGTKPPPKEVQFETEVSHTSTSSKNSRRKQKPKKQDAEEDECVVVKTVPASSKKKQNKAASAASASSTYETESSKSSQSSSSQVFPFPTSTRNLHILAETEEEGENTDSISSAPNMRAHYGKLHNVLYSLATNTDCDDLKAGYQNTFEKIQKRLKDHMKLKEQEKSDPQAAVAQTPLGKKLLKAKLRPGGAKKNQGVAARSPIKEEDKDSSVAESSFSSVSSTTSWKNKNLSTPGRKHLSKKIRNSVLVVKSPWAKQRVTRGIAKKLAAKKEKEIAAIISKELRDGSVTSSSSSSMKDSNKVDLVEEDQEPPKKKRVKRKVEASADGIPDDFWIGQRALCPSAKKRRMEKLQLPRFSPDAISEEDSSLSSKTTKSKRERPPLPPKFKEKKSVDASLAPMAKQASAPVQVDNKEKPCESNGVVAPDKVYLQVQSESKKSEESRAVKVPVVNQNTIPAQPAGPTKENTENKITKGSQPFDPLKMMPYVLVEKMDPLTVAEKITTTKKTEVTDILNEEENATGSVKSIKSAVPSKKKKKTTNHEIIKTDATIEVSTSKSSKLSTGSDSSSVVSSSSTVKSKIEEFKLPSVPETTAVITKTKVKKTSSSSNISSKTVVTLVEPEPISEQKQELKQEQEQPPPQQSKAIGDQNRNNTTVIIETRNETNKSVPISVASDPSPSIDSPINFVNQTFVVPKQQGQGFKKQDVNDAHRFSNHGGGDGDFNNSTGRHQSQVNLLPKNAEASSINSTFVVPNSFPAPDFCSTFVVPPKNPKGITELHKKVMVANAAALTDTALDRYNQNETYVLGNKTFDMESSPQCKDLRNQNSNANDNMPVFSSQPKKLAEVPPTKLTRHGSSSENVLPPQAKQLPSSSSCSNILPPKANVLSYESSDMNKLGKLNLNEKTPAYKGEIHSKLTKTASASSISSNSSVGTFVSAVNMTPKSPTPAKKVISGAVNKPISPKERPVGVALASTSTPGDQGGSTMKKKMFNSDNKAKPTNKGASSSISSSNSSSAESTSTVTSNPRTPTKKLAAPGKEKVVPQGDGSGPGSCHAKPLANANDLDQKKKEEEFQRLLEKQEEGRRKKEMIIQQKKEMQRKKNEEWKAKIEKKKADDKHHQEKIEKSKEIGKLEGIVKAAVQVFAKHPTTTAVNPNSVRHPMNPPNAIPFKSAAIPKHMINTLSKTGASSLPDIHEASDGKAGTSGQNLLLKKSSPAQKVFGSVGQLPNNSNPAVAPKPQLGLPTKKSALQSKMITPIQASKMPVAVSGGMTVTKNKVPLHEQYPFDVSEMDDEGDSFKTADMTVDLENEVISSYDITRYEDLDEDNRHRENKRVPDWAGNDDKLTASLYYQQPEYIRLVRASCFPAKNVGYRLFPHIRH